MGELLVVMSETLSASELKDLETLRCRAWSPQTVTRRRARGLRRDVRKAERSINSLLASCAISGSHSSALRAGEAVPRTPLVARVGCDRAPPFVLLAPVAGAGVGRTQCVVRVLWSM